MSNVLVDTGFWIALYDKGDEHHSAASEIGELLEVLNIVVPWPVMYETLRTRFVRKPNWVGSFHQLLQKPSVHLIDDADYRNDAYAQTIELSLHNHRDISMVDMLCRLLIEDPNVRIEYLFTLNPDDFYDVCADNGVEIPPILPP